MNVSLTNKDAVSATIKVVLENADYQEKVEKELRTLRQKANIPGFRKGMVPMGMIKKMYGKVALVETIEKMVPEVLYGYIQENNVKLLGEPLPSETEQSTLDFDTAETFEFVFDVALAPEVTATLTKKDKIPYYQIKIEEELVNKQIEQYQDNFGGFDKADEVEAGDMVKGTIAELENDLPKAGGILVEDAVLMPSYMKDEEEKAKFMGTPVNSVVIFNPAKAFEGNEVELSSLLKISKEEVANVTGDFSFEIMESTRRKKAELNEELFEKVFGADTVKDADDFRARIREVLEEQVAPQTDYKFMDDVRKLLVEKGSDMQFADDLLKRWLLVANENNTKEKIEDEFPQVLDDLKYQLIKNELMRKYEININDEDVFEFAKKVAKAQFAQYGMLVVPDDVLANYAQDMLKNKETAQNVVERVREEKLSIRLKEEVTLTTKEVTMDEFNELMKENQF